MSIKSGSTTATPASPEINAQMAGPLSMLNFDIPNWMQVPSNLTDAVMDGTTDALSANLLEKFGATFIDPIFQRIPMVGDALMASDSYVSVRTGASCLLLYAAVKADHANIQNQIERGNLKPSQYVPDIVAALVMKAARRLSGDLVAGFLPRLTGFFREADADLRGALGDVTGAPSK